jgi:hypothetical protein
MAIKSKGRSKGRQVARAPRREPVEVKPPFFLRRWVQVTLAFAVGVALVLFGVWVTNGIRASRADEKAANAQTEMKTALSQWKTTVETQIQTVGQLQQQGVAPLIAPGLAPAVGALASGKAPTASGKDLAQLGEQLKKAADTLAAYDLTKVIRNKGFDVGETDRILSVQSGFVTALNMYREAAVVASIAAVASDPAQQAQLGAAAKRLNDDADSAMQEAWRGYGNALFLVGLTDGVATTPAGGIPGVTGGTGPTG